MIPALLPVIVTAVSVNPSAVGVGTLRLRRYGQKENAAKAYGMFTHIPPPYGNVLRNVARVAALCRQFRQKLLVHILGYSQVRIKFF